MSSPQNQADRPTATAQAEIHRQVAAEVRSVVRAHPAVRIGGTMTTVDQVAADAALRVIAPMITRIDAVGAAARKAACDLDSIVRQLAAHGDPLELADDLAQLRQQLSRLADGLPGGHDDPLRCPIATPDGS